MFLLLTDEHNIVDNVLKKFLYKKFHYPTKQLVYVSRLHYALVYYILSDVWLKHSCNIFSCSSWSHGIDEKIMIDLTDYKSSVKEFLHVNVK